MQKPLIVCLCGSTRFKTDFEIANREFTLRGYIVLSVGVFGHAERKNISEETKQKLDQLHLRKIDMADMVYVINPEGYIGDSTGREIAYAEALGKSIYFLEDL